MVLLFSKERNGHFLHEWHVLLKQKRAKNTRMINLEEYIHRKGAQKFLQYPSD